MAASMTVGVAAGVGSIGSVRYVSGLSSSSSFGSTHLKAVAPLRSAATRNVMVARAALPEEQFGRTARREILASLMAAGAAIATAGNSFAASGPGTSGAERTNEKADAILKTADKLTTDESPPRFGGLGGADDSGSIAQKGGAGAVESLQGAGGQSAQGAKDAFSEARSRFEEVLGKKTGDLSDASAVIDNAAGEVSGKVSSDVNTTQSKADSFVADAQSKFDSASKDSQGVIRDLVDKIQGVSQ